jgi:uncharacterized membrane protein
MKAISKTRIESIDVLRGIAMVLMALDHVRDYFHISANLDDPLNLATTTPYLFFTRWITHYCAPIFIFLSGTSVYLQSIRKSRSELSSFLLKRGLWLIFAEWVIVSFAWTFNPTMNLIAFQVIWTIGICMIFLAAMIYLNFSYRTILIAGICIVAFHNLLDFYEASPAFTTNFWWDLFHHSTFRTYEFAPHHYALLAYPFSAWLGVMMLGYCTGKFFVSGYPHEKRKSFLVVTGLSLILLFFAVRFINVYGDPHPWFHQQNSFYTFLSFLNVHKYPPSLLYLCITIGPALLLLAWIENIKNYFTQIMVVFGRTAFFYYILHLYLIHLIASVVFFIRGHSINQAEDPSHHSLFLFVLPGEGFRLPIVYLFWIFIVILLYPVCKKYDRYKSSHPEKKWLSYF